MSITTPRLWSLALALTAALAGAALGASGAQAASSLTCTGHETGTFSPHLTNTPQTVTYTIFEDDSSCSSSTDPAITSGTVNDVLVVPLVTCSALTVGGLRTRTYVWNTGQTSTIAYYATITPGPGPNDYVATRTGLVIAGKFFGAQAVEREDWSVDRSLCATTGLPGYEGEIHLTITGIL